MKYLNRCVLLCVFSVSFLMTDAHALKTLIIVNNSNQETSGTLQLVSSTPYDRQAVSTSPGSVSLDLSQPIKPDKSFIRVYDALGNQLETGPLEAQGKNLSVTLPELSPGRYSVKWKTRCRCSDDNEISDNFHFTVK